MDLFSFLKERSEQQPEDIAFTFLPSYDQELTLTNRQLFQRVSSIATYLSSKTSKAPILLLFNPGLDFISALIGCLANGNIAVPIAIPKPQQLSSFKNILENSQAYHILSETDLIARFSKDLSEYEWVDANEVLNSNPVYEPFPPHPDDIGILQYTSGSTGTPKGVMVSHENLAHNVKAIIDHFKIDSDSTSFSWLPHYHDMGLIDGILMPILTGCHGILTSPRQAIGRPEFWLDSITKYQVTHTGGPNFFFGLCLEKITTEKTWDLSSLKDVYVSAEPVRIKTLNAFARKFESYGFSETMFTPGYGLAEATLMVSCKKAGDPIRFSDFELPSGTIESVSLGKLVPGIEAKIVSPETGIECQDQPGELWLKGVSVTKGYWNNEKESQAAFPTENSGWLKTGDLGIFKNDELYIVGRLKDLIIINGVNYHAEDLEYAVTNNIDLPGRDACLAFSIDSKNREELTILIKVPKSTTTEKLVDLKKEAQKTLYHQFGLAESNIHFHSGPSYAKTTSGKIRRAHNKVLFLKNTFDLLTFEK